jgi:hypothetical protein
MSTLQLSSVHIAPINRTPAHGVPQQTREVPHRSGPGLRAIGHIWSSLGIRAREGSTNPSQPALNRKGDEMTRAQGKKRSELKAVSIMRDNGAGAIDPVVASPCRPVSSGGPENTALGEREEPVESDARELGAGSPFSEEMEHILPGAEPFMAAPPEISHEEKEVPEDLVVSDSQPTPGEREELALPGNRSGGELGEASSPKAVPGLGPSSKIIEATSARQVGGGSQLKLNKSVPPGAKRLSSERTTGAVRIDVSEQLFIRREDIDRSAASWAARLTESAVREAQKSPTAQKLLSTVPMNPVRVASRQRPAGEISSSGALSAGADRPENLPDSTRRFLKPLVGIDPATVSVYQGAAAAQITSANQADAVAVGEAVALTPDGAGESPRQLGVLAHELTHVARRRQPRFVPPIARDSGNRLMATQSAVTSDEEGLAQQVERAVRRAAKAREQTVASECGETCVLSPSAVTARRGDWRGLPAPWERLPAWMTVSPELSPVEHSPVKTGGMEPLGMAAETKTTTTAAPPQRAGQERRVDDDSPATLARPEEQPPEDARQAEPDLDAQARQVYAILKRRLAAERRREML